MDHTIRDVDGALAGYKAIDAARARDGLSGATAAMTKASGFSRQRLLHLRLRRVVCDGDGPVVHDHYAGAFPIGYQETPVREVSCVYALFDTDGELVYIGQSMNVRSRLKEHWRQRGRAWSLDRWAVSVVPPGKSRVEVEAALIARFKPSGNKAGVA